MRQHSRSRPTTVRCMPSGRVFSGSRSRVGRARTLSYQFELHEAHALRYFNLYRVSRRRVTRERALWHCGMVVGSQVGRYEVRSDRWTCN